MASPAAWVALVVLLATSAGAGRDVEVDFPAGTTTIRIALRPIPP